MLLFGFFCLFFFILVIFLRDIGKYLVVTALVFKQTLT